MVAHGVARSRGGRVNPGQFSQVSGALCPQVKKEGVTGRTTRVGQSRWTLGVTSKDVCRPPGLVTNSILFCCLFKIKDRCTKVRFQQMHNQGLRKLLLTVSWDLCA